MKLLNTNTFKSIAEELNVSLKNDTILDEVITKITTIAAQGNVPSTFYPDFAFKQSKVIGILRFLVKEYKYRQELCQELKIPNKLVTMFYDSYGTTPYIRDGVLVEGRTGNAETLKEVVAWFSNHLGLILLESDFDDITEQTLKTLQERAKQKAEDALEIAATNADIYEE